MREEFPYPVMTSFQPPWVVVVDDDPDLAETIAEALHTNGWDVTAFADSATALAAVLRRPPALIICDVEMPGLDGITFSKKVLQTVHQCTVILMSGTQLSKEGKSLVAKNSGRCRFYAKPVSMRTLRALLFEFEHCRSRSSV